MLTNQYLKLGERSGKFLLNLQKVLTHSKNSMPDFRPPHWENNVCSLSPRSTGTLNCPLGWVGLVVNRANPGIEGWNFLFWAAPQNFPGQDGTYAPTLEVWILKPLDNQGTRLLNFQSHF